MNELTLPAKPQIAWRVAQVEALFALPFNELMHRAQTVHRAHFDPNQVQLSTLLSIKTGGCPEDCGYCPQAARYATGVENQDLLSLPAVIAAVSRQKTDVPSVSRRNAWLTRSLAGTALAAGLITISLVASNSYRPQNANHLLPAAASLPAVDSLVAHEPATPKSTQPQKILVTPASWLGDTSGPELEALMDLWEQDQPAVRSLSF